MVSRSVHRILLVDDHPVVRVGIRAQLASTRDLRVVGEAASAADGAAQVSAL
jgi:DNA-binding NarL/FixJ family response regulator